MDLSEENEGFIWKIENFGQVIDDDGILKESPHFCIGDDTNDWSLKIFKDHDKRLNSEFAVQVELHDKHKEKESFIARMSIIDRNEKKTNIKAIIIQENSAVINNFISKDDIVNNGNLLNRNHLRVMCEIFKSKTDQESSRMNYRSHFLQKSLASLYNEGEYCDFKLLVKGEEFNVHRLVLAAESPLFFSMFKKNNNGEASVDSLEPGIMKKLLEFIYTRTLPLDSSAEEMLEITEQFQCDLLKSSCENALKEKLNVENIVRIYLLAHKCNALNLKKQAEKFMQNNASLLQNDTKFDKLVNSLTSEVKTDIMKLLS